MSKSKLDDRLDDRTVKFTDYAVESNKIVCNRAVVWKIY